MDFGLRDWLLIIGPVFVIGILLHGYWRMRANKNKLRMSLDKSFMSRTSEKMSPDEDLSMLRAELPNGGARVRKMPQEQAALDLDELDLDEDVPVLMEPVEIGRRTAAPPPRPEYLIVVYVTALHGPFDGQSLLEALVEFEMQFGEMNIFHRLDHGKPLFSLVNAVEPGTFDIASMSEMTTPAVSLFMRAHEMEDPLAVYDAMIEVAQSLADELGGEVKDDSRSVVTPQTIEHTRESIRDYVHRYSR